MNINKQALRSYVRGAYDMQGQRIQTGNRIVQMFKRKLGLVPGEKEEDIPDAEARKVLADLKIHHKKEPPQNS